MSRLSTKQRRAARRRHSRYSDKMVCRPARISYAGLAAWLPPQSEHLAPHLPATTTEILMAAFDKIAAAENRAWEEILRCAYGPIDEISHVEALQRGLTSADLFAAGWHRCPEKDAWWKPSGA
jgi:hypothetical protein